jgi:formylglycine-generating enzyme required for sulfatase activity
MAGNLREWCLEEHNRMADYRMLRGGSWQHPSGRLETGYRSRRYPSYRSSSVGFRVVCSCP